MITLRPYKSSDYAFVYQTENQVFHSMTPSEFSSYYLDNSLIHIEMIMNDDAVIGYIVIWLDIDKSQIYSMYIKDKYRRKYYAYQACSLLEKDLIKRGVKTWTLEVRQSNLSAINLYKKLGFEIVTSRDDYYQDHEDAWLMLKDIKKD